MNPFWFHLDNLLLHAAAAVFLFLIVRRLGVRPVYAFLAVLLWALNPQKVESVAWLAERKDVLCGVFSFAAVWCFLRAFSRRKISWAAGILCVCALFSKPSAAAIPGVLLVYAVCLVLRKRVTFRKAAGLCAAPLLIFFAGFLWAWHVTAKTNPGHFETNLLVPFSNLFRYPLTALVPYDLNPVYPTIGMWSDILPVIAAGVVLLCLFLIAAVRLRFGGEWILCVLLIVGGTSVPVLELWRLGPFDFCDRYNYQISAAVLAVCAILAGRAVRMVPKSGRILIPLFTVWVLVFAFMTAAYLPVWRDMDSLSKSIIRREGRINGKGFEMALVTAFRTENRAYLVEILDDLPRLDPYQKDYSAGRSVTKQFLLGHLAMTAGKFSEAAKIFADLRSEMLSNPESLFPWEGILNVFYHDYAVMENYRGNIPSAVNFLKKELAVLEKKHDRSMRYYCAAAMKADLEKDNAALLKAWRNILQLNPAMRPQFERVKKAKGL